MAIAIRAGLSTTAFNTLSIAFTVPAEVVEGDLMVVQVGSNQAQKVTAHDVPAGWTSILAFSKTSPASTVANDSGISTLGRIAGAAEAGTSHTFTATAPSTHGMTLQMVALTGHHATNWLNAVSSAGINTAGGQDISYPGLTPTVNDCMLMAYAQLAGDPDVTDIVAPTGMTEQQQSSRGTATSNHQVGHINTQLLAGGANVAIAGKTSTPVLAAATVYDTGLAVGGMVAIAPASTAPAPIYNETFRPVPTVVLSNFTGAATDVDQDPDDATITDAGLSPVVDP